MITLAANIAAIILYTAAGCYLIATARKQQKVNAYLLVPLTVVVLCLHGIGLYGKLITPTGLHLNLFNSASLIFWVVNTLVLLSGIKKPLHNLFIFLFPLSAILVLGATAIHHSGTSLPHHQVGIISHILLSILAYSLLIIATLQALLLAFQNHQIKHKHPRGLVQLLPPLQTMESLLFELLWLGETFLLAAIITGLVYIDDLFAQHLAHKTVFTLVAFTIYAILLWGRFKLGWRGTTAIRWTLGGFAALMLAYFGSKMVLEFLIHS